MGSHIVRPREGGAGLGVDGLVLHLEGPDAQLEHGVPVVLGEEIAVHEVDDVRDDVLARGLELLDEPVPEQGEVLLADLVAVARGAEAHVALDFLDEAGEFAYFWEKSAYVLMRKRDGFGKDDQEAYPSCYCCPATR